MCEGVVVLAVREDRGRSADGNDIDEGSRWLKQHQFFIDVVGSSLFFRWIPDDIRDIPDDAYW